MLQPIRTLSEEQSLFYEYNYNEPEKSLPFFYWF